MLVFFILIKKQLLNSFLNTQQNFKHSKVYERYDYELMSKTPAIYYRHDENNMRLKSFRKNID